MKGMLGCLFILLFAGVFIAIGLVRSFLEFLFPGLWGANKPNYDDHRHAQRAQAANGGSTRAGNARHETRGQNAANTAGGKIFGKDEGTYVDFEEIK